MDTYKPYCKPHLKMIIDKAKDYIPKGDFCDESTMFGVHCPFLQYRKMTPNRLKQFEDIVIDDNGVARFIYDIPCNNKYLQYCSYLKRYLVIQDCIKDCHINIEDNE